MDLIDREIKKGMDRSAFDRIMSDYYGQYVDLWQYIPHEKHPHYREFTRIYRRGLGYARKKSGLFPLFDDSSSDGESDGNSC